MGTMVDPIRRGSFDNTDKNKTSPRPLNQGSGSNAFAFLKNDYTKEEIDKIFLEDIFLQGHPELHFQSYDQNFRQRRLSGLPVLPGQPHQAIQAQTAPIELDGSNTQVSSKRKRSRTSSNTSVKSNKGAPGRSKKSSTKPKTKTISGTGKKTTPIKYKTKAKEKANKKGRKTTGKKNIIDNKYTTDGSQVKEEGALRQETTALDFGFSSNNFGVAHTEIQGPGFTRFDNSVQLKRLHHELHGNVKASGDHLLPFNNAYRQPQLLSQQPQAISVPELSQSMLSKQANRAERLKQIYNPKKKLTAKVATDTSKLHTGNINSFEAQSSVFKKRREKWSTDEMEKLWEAIISCGNNWTAVSKKVVTRNYFQIKDKGRRELCVRGWETGRKKTEGKEAMRQAQLIAQQELDKLRQGR